MPSENILMGKFGAAVGLKGQIRLNYYSDNLDLIKKNVFSTQLPNGQIPSGQNLKLSFIRHHKNQIIVSVEGFSDRTAVETLCGKEIFLPRKSLPQINDKNEFYINDLVGCEVLVAEKKFGIVKQILNYGAGDIIEIETANGENVMFSFTNANFPQINLEKKQIICNPPEIMLSEQKIIQHKSSE
jgi:16S rRNA processing protein RimM